MAHTIEIDFDVFKALTARRETEAVSHNDVIRELLGLPNKEAAPTTPTGGDNEWLYKGVRFPVGAEFRAAYKGISYFAKVEKRGLALNGQVVGSPSLAARLVTNTNVNGWVFWECRFPGESRWRQLASLKPNS